MKAGIRMIDRIRGTEIFARYHELRRMASDAAAIDSARKKNLTELLSVLKKKNTFYKPLLERFSSEELKSYPQIVLSSMPVIDKQIINSHYNEVFTPIPGRPSQKKKTGGSTGNPFYYHVDKDHLSWFWAHIYFFWNFCSGYSPGDPFVTIAGNSLRTANRRFSEKIYHYLQNNYFIKGDVIDESLRVNIRKINKAKLLYGYPSSIQNLIKARPELPGKFSNLVAIFTTSEQLLPQTRSMIEQAFGKPVFDMYGANDGGILTCECTEHSGYHINTLNCLVENIRNEHNLCELLLTNLSSYSFPFVRYRVGDLGKLETGPCKCGLPWPRIVELKGRTRDLIKLPGGGAIHGSYFNNIFYRFTEVDGYRIVQQKDFSIEIHIHTREEADYTPVARDIADFIKTEMPALVFHLQKMPDYNPTNAKFKLIESHAG